LVPELVLVLPDLVVATLATVLPELVLVLPELALRVQRQWRSTTSLVVARDH